ncbi:protein BIG GRAIN 1-like B [Abrus precatorius]|uniref:Protein BIG GRAIN 1-like B n=1 Tax=Abrus precatorius TaxID=3816 RepID=A0A8B8LI20_ABRPR|nr:protein BIG GRAIN 1-like B [Abrus precatorius]
MYRLEKARREQQTFLLNDAKNPSFSSTLLDKIYRSIDEGERKSGEMKFYTETTGKKQSRAIEAEELMVLEKWMDRKGIEKSEIQRGQWKIQTDRKSHRRHDHDQDVLFFSSTSSSSDSSSGLLSSSDTESMYGVRSRVSCFAPPRPKPVKTSVTSEKTHIASNEESLIKSKSRALKIYNNLKKVKQPISPGGKLTNFLNSLFTTGNSKKSKGTPTSTPSFEDVNAERKAKSGQASTCSSASSFSRSCLSKTSPSSRDKSVKRTVRFYPVSVIVGEDSRPCGHKCLYEREDTSLMAVSVPTAWKIGKSCIKKNDEEVLDKSKRVEETAREFLKEYHRNQRKSDLILRDFPNEDEDDDDAASYSSSDLFELDHLAVMGNNRYCEELPVYETTHVSTNRAIANGFIM